MLNKIKKFVQKIFNKPERIDPFQLVPKNVEVENERAIGLALELEDEIEEDTCLKLIDKGLKEFEKAAVKVIRDPIFEKIDELYLIQERTKKFRIRKKQDRRITELFDKIDKKIWS